MIMKKYIIYPVIFLFILFTSCKKNAVGGKAQVTGFVEFNGSRIPNAIVYIKYGATTSPGEDPTQYDSQQTADGTGTFTFASLYPGNYYLYAIGHYVTQLGYEQVTGGTQVNIPHTKSSVNYDIATNK
jgi:hypothetical protein